ncbi:LOW QUALITY PROTEIN: hypothetical protein KUTeg_020333 [Tegillarca granosa]|uniref:Inter-alpha-trypsin inhibitor heavy chain H3 n=1 Tax=Tegillarca granosa TaxID=220873 RepID=A0ABQ9EBY9_TEGGR|nr:LOW QUALITY PROTEIN: hypothetical protein KUTeg_020333 [Tegillarca granosa]
MASDIWFYISVFVFSSGILTQGQEEPSIYFLHVRSDIRYRYATTLVTSKVVNPAQVSREVLNINGVIYIGEVKEKEEARQQYEQAKSKGQSSGHISVKPRHANIFNMAVNVEAMGKVTFNLTYEERVTRKLGKYRHVIYINPGQPVEDFQIELSLLESREITSVKVLPIQNDILTNTNTETDESNDMAIILRPTAKSAYILYNSSLEDQTRRDPSGISGQFVVEYNVDRQTNAGDLLVVNGYFVHYFDFDDIEPFSKDMVFLLDVSDSMRGRKLEQLKAAMFEILDDVHENDRLNIITFSSSVRYWKGHQLIRATKENINSAKKFIKNFHAHESTNIDLAMKSGIQLLSQKSQNQRAPVLIFLTDGRATVGEILPDNILNNVLTWNEGAIPIFSLSFGEKGDYNFVRRVAAQNNGFGRKIFEDSDSDLQIKGFYDEIATVLLKNLTFTYLNTSVDKESLTQLKFNTYFVGSEILVAGKLTNGESNSITVSVSSASLRGFIQLNNYSFVTPFTSMVVTLPNATETQSLENSFEDTAIPPRTGFVAKKSNINFAPNMSIRFHIHSEIKYRFARTVISSTVENIADKAEEIKFDVAIPNNAFISNMTIPRRANKFQLRVNVEAKKLATFNLTYEELLRRHTGKYEHTIYISPGKPVHDFKVDVSILESRDIKKLKVPEIRQDIIQSKDSLQTDSLTNAVIKQPVPTEANIEYCPTVDEQKSVSASGISGQLVVEYDVDRNKDAGDILVSGGYFVHFFGASGIPPLPKQILFVLDKSGSMIGKKMDHLKQAMLNILKDIKENDEFNFIMFDKIVKIWSPSRMVLGLKENKDSAIYFLNNELKARGGLHGTEHITNNILNQNTDHVPMFGLAFGERANLELVNKLAIQNSGFSRKIFTDSDADLQIQGFYDEISTVVMTNVTFQYLESEVDLDSVTDSYVNTLFDGSEHVVSGETTANELSNIQSLVQGNGADGMLVLRNPLFLTQSRIQYFELGRFTERLYAFLVIKKLIQKIEASNLKDTQSEKELLSLSLKISKMIDKLVSLLWILFLTDVQSAVVENKPVATDVHPYIQQLHIQSDIRYRFSTTIVKSKMIDGKIHVGEVKEKAAAKKQFEDAKALGQSAGPRETNKFNIEVNLAAKGTVNFVLTYQELLRRKLGLYEHVTYINPGQLVEDFKVEVAIQESREISTLEVPAAKEGFVNPKPADTGIQGLTINHDPTSKSAYILYQPTLEQQKLVSEKGVAGQFVVKYGVNREENAGEILLVNGYFVHYFAVDSAFTMPKDVLFVLDTSGSMNGRKIIQLRDAMLNILADVQPKDKYQYK